MDAAQNRKPRHFQKTGIERRRNPISKFFEIEPLSEIRIIPVLAGSGPLAAQAGLELRAGAIRVRRI
jgi:hypothetical protein